MKFWQLLSIFSDEKELLETQFSKEKWYKYLTNYYSMESLVNNQERAILDAEIEVDLLKAICEDSKKCIYLSNDKTQICSYKNIDTGSEISMKEAITLFDHDSIEEAFEKTYSNVNPRGNLSN